MHICDPSDQNESHVGNDIDGKRVKYYQILLKSFFAHFQILLEMGTEICL